MMFSFLRRSKKQHQQPGAAAAQLAPAVRPVWESLEDRVLLSVAPTTVHASTTTVKPAATQTYSLGGNLQTQNQYCLDHAFTDLVKAVDNFKGPSGSGAVATDSNGWPTADFSADLWDTNGFGVKVDTGRYNVSFKGPSTTVVGSLSAGVKITKVSYNSSTGINTYAVDVAPGTGRLALKFIHTGGAVKNLKVLQPGYSLSSYPVFTNKYVNMMKSLHPDTLRLMDFTQANNSTDSNWTSRSKPTDALYKHGVPWEYCIQLMNQLHSNIWVNIPGHADNGYVQNLANLLKYNLDPSLKIYVEYSNEVWNTIYDQGRYNIAQTKTEVASGKTNLKYDGDNNIYDLADRRYARRSKEIADIFRGVFTVAGQPSPINTRIRVILSGQVANSSRYTNELKYINTVYGAPKKWFYGIGIGSYFGLNKYADQQDATGKWTNSNKNVTVDQILQGMGLSIDAWSNGRFASKLAIAAPYGLKLEAYEGGEDTIGPFNIAAKKAANLDPRIEPLIQRFMQTFKSQGGDLFNWFSLGSRTFDGPYGTWTLTNNINNLNAPKEQVFRILRGYAPKV